MIFRNGMENLFSKNFNFSTSGVWSFNFTLSLRYQLFLNLINFWLSKKDYWFGLATSKPYGSQSYFSINVFAIPKCIWKDSIQNKILSFGWFIITHFDYNYLFLRQATVTILPGKGTDSVISFSLPSWINSISCVIFL